MKRNEKFVIGMILLVIAFCLITTGGGLSWGRTGALWAAGSVLAIYGVVFLNLSED